MADINSTDLVQQFASDNYSGICPEVWAAMETANRGHVSGYGDDPWTAAAADAFRELFETDCEVFFAFNGTAANSLALASLCQSYHSVICCQSAHVETDECGAPEFFSNGSKLVVAESDDGKLTPDAIQRIAINRTDIHFPKPRAVTISQSTETGRVYTVEELHALSLVCEEHGLRFHMDGARFANACASIGCSPADLSWKSGVDVLCFGGTKNGMAVGEAILFLTRNWRKILTTAATRRDNLHPKCASWPRPGWACWRRAHGCATPFTPMRAPGIWPRDCRVSRGSSLFPSQRRMRYSPTLPTRFSRQCANGDGSSTRLSGVRRGLCA